jgi:hypothetical protein
MAFAIPTSWLEPPQAIGYGPQAQAADSRAGYAQSTMNVGCPPAYRSGAEAATWLHSFVANSKRLAALPKGWDGPGSIPTPEGILYRAERITRDALIGLPDAASPYLVPAGNGGVQIEWHGTAGEIELTIVPGGGLHFWGRDHLTGTEREGQDEEARALFFRWAPWIATARDDGVDDTLSPGEIAVAPGFALRSNSAVA